MLTRVRQAAVNAAFLFATILIVAAPALSQGRAVDFSLRAIDGDTVTADSLHGEVAVLAFGAAWLPLSRNQLEAVKKLADDYAGRGVAVYWIGTDSESPKSKNYATDEQLRALARKYKVTILRDPDGAVARKFGVDQLPSVVILDRQGKISGGPIGGMDPNANLAAQLAARLDKIL